MPSGPTATSGNALVDLAWPGEYGALSYNLYRATTAGAEGTTPYQTGLATSAYEDTGLTNGTAYYYTVTAVNATGESAQSAEVSATPMLPAVPAAPTGLTATAKDSVVILNWDFDANADSYNVYRSTTEGTGYTKINTSVVTDEFYSDATAIDGSTYYYVVTAVNAGGESGNSNEVTASPAASLGPAAPDDLSATPGNGSVALAWTTVPAATSYTVYKRDHRGRAIHQPWHDHDRRVHRSHSGQRHRILLRRHRDERYDGEWV